jgi:hypothetical protein
MSITQTIANDLVLDIDLGHHERTTALAKHGAVRPHQRRLVEGVARAAQRTSAANFLTLWVEGSYKDDDGRDTYERNIGILKRLARAIWESEGQSPVVARRAYRDLRSFVIEQFTAFTAYDYGCSHSTAQRGVIRALEIIAEREGGDARELLDDFNIGLGYRLIDIVWEDAIRAEKSFPAYAAI